MSLWNRGGARRAPGEAAAAPGSTPGPVAAVDLEQALGDRAVWGALVGRIQDQFGRLPSRVQGRSLVGEALAAGVAALERFDRTSLWRRLLPEGAGSEVEESLRLKLRLALFYAVVFRFLGGELAVLRVTRGSERWDPLGRTTFRDFATGSGGDGRVRLARDAGQVHGGYPLLLACSLFGRQEIDSTLGRQASQEAFLYMAPGGRDSLFGQILGEEVVNDAGVSPDVARKFLEVLRSDVETKRVDVNVNPCDVLVLPGWLYLIYPQGYKRVLRHLGRESGIDVLRRDELLVEVVRLGAILDAKGVRWEVPEGDGWKNAPAPPGVCVARIVFPGQPQACRLKGVVLREGSVFADGLPETVERFDGGVTVFGIDPRPKGAPGRPKRG